VAVTLVCPRHPTVLPPWLEHEVGLYAFMSRALRAFVRVLQLVQGSGEVDHERDCSSQRRSRGPRTSFAVFGSDRHDLRATRFPTTRNSRLFLFPTK
jgi:hypothetical protein